MTASEFNELSIDDKCNVLIKHGTYTDERVIYGRYHILTYSLFNYYVEAYYHASNKEIAIIKANEAVEDWESYMDSISLNSLLKAVNEA